MEFKSCQSVFCILCVCSVSVPLFVGVFVYVGVGGWVPIAGALSVVCGRAQPSQPQSWHRPLPGRIAGLSQLPLQLSGSLKSGPGNLQRALRNTCELYDGCPVDNITKIPRNTDASVQSRLYNIHMSPCIICLGQTYNNVLKQIWSSHSSSVSSYLLIQHLVNYVMSHVMLIQNI